MQQETRDLTERLLKLHEGWSAKPYKCSAGALTVGWGHNLDAKGIKPEVGDLLLRLDILDAIADARALVPNFDEHDAVRQAVILDMSFNLGRDRLAKFERTLASFVAKNYTRTAEQMLESKWATQVGRRATRLAEMMRTGVIPEEV